MTRKRLTTGDVVSEALVVLERTGIEGVTLRGVAKSLNVHLNSVSFQVGTKAQLVELMADAILGDLSLIDLPSEPRDRITELARQLRLVLLAHRDGARVVAGTDVWESNTVAVAEVMISALLELGADDLTATRTSWCLHYLILGLVQEEQAAGSTNGHRFISEIAAGEYPALSRVGTALVDDPYSQRIEFGIAALLQGVPGSAQDGRSAVLGVPAIRSA